MNKKREVKHHHNTGSRKALQSLREGTEEERKIDWSDKRGGGEWQQHTVSSITQHFKWLGGAWCEAGTLIIHRSRTMEKFTISSFGIHYIQWKYHSYESSLANPHNVLSSGKDKCHKCKAISLDVCVFTGKPGPIYSSFVACLLLVPNLHLTPWTMKGFQVKAIFCVLWTLQITLVPVGQPHFLFLPTSCFRIIFFLFCFHIPSRLFFPLSGLLSDSTHIILSSFLPPKCHTL